VDWGEVAVVVVRAGGDEGVFIEEMQRRSDVMYCDKLFYGRQPQRTDPKSGAAAPTENQLIVIQNEDDCNY